MKTILDVDNSVTKESPSFLANQNPGSRTAVLVPERELRGIYTFGRPGLEGLRKVGLTDVMKRGWNGKRQESTDEDEKRHWHAPKSIETVDAF